MKLLLKIIGGVFAFVMLLVGVIFLMTSSITGLASDFYDATSKQQYKQAYQMLSEDFQSSYTEEKFYEFIRANDLNKVIKKRWHSRSVENDKGILQGTLTLSDHTEKSIQMEFLKQNDNWTISAIFFVQETFSQSQQALSIPSEDKQVELVRESMDVFANSIKDHSMAKLHGHISEYWRQQISVEKLDQIFNPFYVMNDGLLVINEYQPQFTKPTELTEQGVLIIEGQYPTQPNKVYFTHKYILEGFSWKLIGINVNIR
ncbi:MAG: hypothetical protein HWE13_02070 [Gammaproteobacteria bacterium]|nr:hypothetical protein [Gammaproteobacteria bacterium]